jgi:hypothetical protein
MPNTKPPPGYQPQERDYRLLRRLFHCRLLTIKHAAALFFNGSAEAAGKRLQKLTAAKVIRRREGKFNEPNVYEFTAAAFDLLKEHKQLDRYAHLAWTDAMNRRARVGKSKLRHELAVMDIQAALQPAIEAQPGFQVVEFGTWPMLYQFEVERWPDTKKQTITVRPDGFLRIVERGAPSDQPDYYDAFLEVDKGSEEHERLTAKVGCYSRYYRGGGFAHHHGYSGAPYKKFPFRVLIVLDSAERRNNFCERLLYSHSPGATQVWLSTLPELLADPLGPVWIRPRDYAAAVADTPFNPAKRQPSRFYIPNPEREACVTAHAQRWGFFEDPSEAVHNRSAAGVVQYDHDPAASS